MLAEGTNVASGLSHFDLMAANDHGKDVDSVVLRTLIDAPTEAEHHS